jgi:hypothetical protein
MSSEEIAVVEQVDDADYTPVVHGTLFGTDDPVAVIDRATDVANALMGAVRRHDEGKPANKRLVSVISGREFPKVECWVMLGTMLGVFPVLEGEPERIEIDGVSGWKATVAAMTRDGAVVGRASALCMRSESSWRNRDEYAIASMAQTRATSKALSQPLRFVMILAGFEGTPEAEMPPPGPVEIRSDGHEPARSAKSYAEWLQRMEALEVPDPEEWAREAVEASGVTTNKLQRLNRVMLHLSDTEPASSLGFWSTEELQAAFAVGFNGVLVTVPAPQPVVYEEDESIGFGEDGQPVLPLEDAAT